MVEIVKFIFQLVILVLFGIYIVHVNLRPTGNAGFYLEPQSIKWKFFNEYIGKIFPDGSRPHQAHVAHQDIEKLGQLIKPSFTQNATDSRKPWVIPFCPAGVGLC